MVINKEQDMSLLVFCLYKLIDSERNVQPKKCLAWKEETLQLRAAAVNGVEPDPV